MRVLIVDDSALIRSILKEEFKDDPEICIVGEAGNGERAVAEVHRLTPDLVIMDVNMPVLDGIQATRRIMSERPVPIVVFSSEVDAELGFRACQAGAVDVMRKPDIGRLNDETFRKELRSLLLGVGRRANGPILPSPGHASPRVSQHAAIGVIVIGASTGGPSAVRTILSDLPRELAAPVAVVQHLGSGFERGYVEWLDNGTALTVKLVAERTTMRPGEVYVAPPDRHLLVEGSSLVLDDGPPLLNQRPSVNRLFVSAAESWGEAALGVLLTGMGSDGAEGCLEILRRGGATIVEDRSTAVIFGMPRAAIEMQAASQVVPLPGIPHEILTRVGVAK